MSMVDFINQEILDRALEASVRGNICLTILSELQKNFSMNVCKYKECLKKELPVNECDLIDSYYRFKIFMDTLLKSSLKQSSDCKLDYTSFLQIAIEENESFDFQDMLISLTDYYKVHEQILTKLLDTPSRTKKNTDIIIRLMKSYGTDKRIVQKALVVAKKLGLPKDIIEFIESRNNYYYSKTIPTSFIYEYTNDTVYKLIKKYSSYESRFNMQKLSDNTIGIISYMADSNISIYELICSICNSINHDINKANNAKLLVKSLCRTLLNNPNQRFNNQFSMSVIEELINDVEYYEKNKFALYYCIQHPTFPITLKEKFISNLKIYHIQLPLIKGVIVTHC